MQENLVIVESPAKAKTIEKFLGKEYAVKSSFGHIRDLPKKELSIDIEKGFVPTYEIPKEKSKLVAELSKAAAEAKTVWLASDEDREGEAIAWHLTEVLGLSVENTKRIVFHEITKNAILNAIENPRKVDMNLVSAQQARRVLDRIVGFELSPILWKKVRPALSAGRVQSVAVRLIVEREREIINFKDTSSYRVVAQFYPASDSSTALFKAEYSQRFATKEEAMAMLESCKTATFSVESSEMKPSKRYPAPPFTTSTLQQEAGRKYSMSVSQTMSVAQKLYERGLITYMRTDSVNLSDLALAACKKEICQMFGDNYSARRPNSGSIGTRAYQMALFVIFESGLHMLADNPTLYYNNDDCTRFIASVPLLWDSTKALSAKLGDHLIVAKKSGEKWFLGGMTAERKESLIKEVTLDFLPEGKEFTLTSFEDGSNADRQAMHYVKRVNKVRKGDTITIKMVRNGGYAAVIE